MTSSFACLRRLQVCPKPHADALGSSGHLSVGDLPYRWKEGVHSAARGCLPSSDLDQLVAQREHHARTGLAGERSAVAGPPAPDDDGATLRSPAERARWVIGVVDDDAATLTLATGRSRRRRAPTWPRRRRASRLIGLLVASKS